jgi:hypothetical protein
MQQPLAAARRIVAQGREQGIDFLGHRPFFASTRWSGGIGRSTDDRVY